MQVLIIDDEEKARDLLRLLLEHHIPEVKDIKIADGAEQATEILKDYFPEIVFLDIKMPGKDGFTWLQELEDRTFRVIFTTAHDEYAIRAIRFSAFDYLLKPIDSLELRNAIDRYLADDGSSVPSYENLFYNAASPAPLSFKLTINTNQRTYYLDPDSILYCLADGNYTQFNLEDGRRILASKPIGHYEDLLDSLGIVRCHKSYLVNLSIIEQIGESKLNLKNNVQVPVSRRRKAMVKTLLDHFNHDGR